MIRTTALVILVYACLLLISMTSLHLLAYSLDFEVTRLLVEQLVIYLFLAIAMGALITLLLGYAYLKWVIRARAIERPYTAREIHLLNMLNKFAEQSNIRTPVLAVYESDSVNAFTVGWHKKRSRIVLSTALLTQCHEDELSAVMAHEVAHIASGDMLAMTLARGAFNTLVYYPGLLISYLVSMGYSPLRKQVFRAAYFGLMMVFGWLAHLFILGVSRHCEYRADKCAALLVGHHVMKNALISLYSIDEKLKSERGPGTTTFGRINKVMQRLLSSHPGLLSRVTALNETV